MVNTKKEDTKDIGTDKAIKPTVKPFFAQERITIQRGNNVFEVPLRLLLTNDINAFLCRKCNHKWLPNHRNFNKIPSHCPKCQDKYWFLSKEQAKKIMQERSHTSYSLDKAELKGLSNEKKKIIKKEVKEEW